MIDMLKRHEIQVLRRVGHSLGEVARLAGVGRRSVVRVEAEAAVSHIDNQVERALREIGRPSKAEPFRGFVVQELAKEPTLMSLEVLRPAKLQGYSGGRSALYALILPSSTRACARSGERRSSIRCRYMGTGVSQLEYLARHYDRAPPRHCRRSRWTQAGPPSTSFWGWLGTPEVGLPKPSQSSKKPRRWMTARMSRAG
jgi:hypothetical protein